MKYVSKQEKNLIVKQRHTIKIARNRNHSLITNVCTGNGAAIRIESLERHIYVMYCVVLADGSATAYFIGGKTKHVEQWAQFMENPF